MKSLMIAAASLMIVANAQAEQLDFGVEMTPVVESKQIATAKSDERFSNYALENSASN
jgi:hypothetical protein